MINTSGRVFRHALRCFGVAAMTCCAFSVNAQTDSTAQLNAFVLKTYNAYQQKDQQTLLSLHSESSPYLAEFREMISKDFSRRQHGRSERKFIRGLHGDVQAGKATLRLVVKRDFRHIETGRRAE